MESDFLIITLDSWWGFVVSPLLRSFLPLIYHVSFVERYANSPLLERMFKPPVSSWCKWPLSYLSGYPYTNSLWKWTTELLICRNNSVHSEVIYRTTITKPVSNFCGQLHDPVLPCLFKAISSTKLAATLSSLITPYKIAWACLFSLLDHYNPFTSPNRLLASFHMINVFFGFIKKFPLHNFESWCGMCRA